jgi:hypothetical protein
LHIKDIFGNDTSKYKTYWGKPLNGDDYANPCGLVAKSYFNGKLFLKINTQPPHGLILLKFNIFKMKKIRIILYISHELFK